VQLTEILSCPPTKSSERGVIELIGGCVPLTGVLFTPVKSLAGHQMKGIFALPARFGEYISPAMMSRSASDGNVPYLTAQGQGSLCQSSEKALLNRHYSSTRHCCKVDFPVCSVAGELGVEGLDRRYRGPTYPNDDNRWQIVLCNRVCQTSSSLDHF
jgi:hypothetical protein